MDDSTQTGELGALATGARPRKETAAMKQLGFATLAVLGLGVLHAAEAQAQPYPQQRFGGPQGAYLGVGAYRPGYQPAVQPVSPFLNLANGGNPAVNYYGIVQPQIDFRNQLTQL